MTKKIGSTTTTAVTAQTIALHPIPGARTGLLALADVEVTIAGVALVLHGVQLRADAAGTEVTAPRFRDSAGRWRTAITLPMELRGPLGDTVIAAALDAGLVVPAGSQPSATAPAPPILV
ncbi:MAG: hypothetical protein M0006_15910 [Magnetospirillum sp.]|nr:hypothetical protein [Magnetospirillum sp.]